MHSALCRAGGLLKNLIDNLDGENGQEWLEVLRRTLRRQNAFEIPHISFEPAFSVDMEDYEDDQVIDELKSRSRLFVGVEEYFRERDRKWFHFGGRPFAQQIVITTPERLGVQPQVGRASFLPNLWVRAEEYGLKPCYDSTAPLAVLQRPKWFSGKQVYFASSPVKGKMWYVDGKVKDKVHLHTCPASFRTEVWPDELWAFCLDKS